MLNKENAHSIEAERAVIGQLINSTGSLKLLKEVSNRLDSRDFYDPVYRKIYRLMIQLSRGGYELSSDNIIKALNPNKPQKDSFNNEVIGRVLYLMSCDMKGWTNILAYSDIIHARAEHRRSDQDWCNSSIHDPQIFDYNELMNWANENKKSESAFIHYDGSNKAVIDILLALDNTDRNMDKLSEKFNELSERAKLLNNNKAELNKALVALSREGMLVVDGKVVKMWVREYE